jgi:hypothetical protein
MVDLVFRIGPGVDQGTRIKAIRKKALGLCSKAQIQEDWASEVVYMTVTGLPEPLHPVAVTLLFDEPVTYRESN